MTTVKQGATTVAQYWYDGLNRQITRNVEGAISFHVWDGWNLIEERGTGNAIQNIYLYAGDQIIENVTTKRFFFQDSLGNTSHLSDEAGNLLERYTYSAFGLPTFYTPGGTVTPGNVSTKRTRHLFQGQLWTQETGLNDYRNRVQLPTMGVFLQPDPIGFKGDAANIYRFCTNNAVNRTDPLGLVSTSGVQLYSRLTSWNGGGDWIKGSDGLSALDWNDKWSAQAGMDNGGGGSSSSDSAGGKSMSAENEGKKASNTDYPSFNEAAAAQKEDAYNLMRRDREAGTEIWQKADGSPNYRSDKPRVTGGVYRVNDGIQKGKFLGFEVDPKRAPPGYRIAGWMYAHPFYRPEVPPADQRRAFNRGWNVYLVTPARADRRFETRNVVTYNYPDNPTD